MNAEVLHLLSLLMLLLAAGILLIILVSSRQGPVHRPFGLAGAVSAIGILVLAVAFRSSAGALPIWMAVGSTAMILGSILMIRGVWKSRRGGMR